MDEDQALLTLKPQLRSESDWLRIFSGRLTLNLLPEPSDQSLTACAPVTVQADSRMKITQLKEKLAQHLQSNGYACEALRVWGTSAHLPLKDTMTLAFFNVAD